MQRKEKLEFLQSLELRGSHHHDNMEAAGTEGNPGFFQETPEADMYLLLVPESISSKKEPQKCLRKLQ